MHTPHIVIYHFRIPSVCRGRGMTQSVIRRARGESAPRTRYCLLRTVSTLAYRTVPLHGVTVSRYDIDITFVRIQPSTHRYARGHHTRRHVMRSYAAKPASAFAPRARHHGCANCLPMRDASGRPAGAQRLAESAPPPPQCNVCSGARA